MQIEVIIAAASAVAALLAALYAARATRTAEKSLKLAMDDHNERHASIQARLIDAIAWENEDKANLIAIACTLINRSAAPNTVVDAELHLHEFDESGQTTKLILSPTPGNIPSNWSLQLLPLPLNLLARSTESGCIRFRIPDHIASKRRIDKYKVIFLSSVGDAPSVELHVVRKVQDVSTSRGT